MKKIIFVVMFLLPLMVPLFAQTTLNGTVQDEYGKPLIGANISIQGSSIGTITDIDGNFSFENITEPQITIEVSYLGYETRIIPWETQYSHLQTILKEDQFQLLDVVVSANKKSQSLQHVPMAISTISPVELRRAGAKGFRDYANGIPNLSFGTQGGDGGGRYFNEISIRGITGFNTTAMYLDDTPLPESIDPNLIDIAQVEVLKGPQGTLYGSATMGGAIKVNTNQPNTRQTEGSLGLTASTVKEGDFNYGFNGLYNKPLTDKIALRASGYYDFTSGIFDRVVNTDVSIINSETTLTEDWYGDPINTTTDGCEGCSTERKENVDNRRNYGFNASLGFYPNKNISIIPKVIYQKEKGDGYDCLLYTSPSPRDQRGSRMPSSA